MGQFHGMGIDQPDFFNALSDSELYAAGIRFGRCIPYLRQVLILIFMARTGDK